MDKLKAYIIGFVVLVIAIAVGIIYKWGFWMLVRIVLGLGFLGLTLMLGFFLALTLYAESWKYAGLLIVPTALSGYAAYLSITWQKLKTVGGIILLFVLGLAFGIWYISEPDLSLTDRFRSAESLERAGKYKAAARKYEKKGNYLKAAEMYEKLSWMESAAWAYEKAEKYERAAEIYEQLYEKEKDTYYLKEAHEYWKKAGIADFPYPLLKRISELRKQDENGFPLQLGFGTGWEGMTIGAPLKDDPRWPEIHRRYELGKAPKAKTQTPPEEFPASRRVAVGEDGRPRLPLGWVWIGWEVV